MERLEHAVLKQNRSFRNYHVKKQHLSDTLGNCSGLDKKG